MGGFESCKDCKGSIVFTLYDKPAWTLGDKEHDYEEEYSNEAFAAEHSSPHLGSEYLLEERVGVFGCGRAGENGEIGQIRQEKTYGDCELV